MHAALIKRRVANLAPVAGRGFEWYWEGLPENPRANAGTAPDGTNTAVKLTASTSTQGHYILAAPPSHAPATPQNAPYTFSVFVKSAGWRHVIVSYQWDYTDHWLTLDLLTGTYTMPPAGSLFCPRAYRVETLVDGWYRVHITEIRGVGTESAPVIYLTDANGNDAPGDGVSGVLLWGYQVNAGGPAPYNPAPPPV